MEHPACVLLRCACQVVGDQKGGYTRCVRMCVCVRVCERHDVCV